MAEDKESPGADNDGRPEMSLPQWSFERTIASLSILARFGLEHGVPVRDLLAGTGLREPQLADPACTVSGRQELQVMKNLIGRLGDAPALGLEAGQRYHFTAFGALGLALASSATLRSALDVGQRFSELAFGFTRVEVEDTPHEVRVSIDTQVPETLRRFVVECTSAVMLTVARDLAGAALPLRQVAFRFGAPPCVAPYERLFGVRPAFRSSANRLTFDRAGLERRLALANDHALRLSEQACQRLLERGRARTGLAAKVRDRLERRIRQMPDMDEVADDLHLTPRTLRRRLQEEGTSFKALRDEVRMRRAEELLAGPRPSVEEIAESVGYANATSFINAFKRRHGRTPRGFRSAKG